MRALLPALLALVGGVHPLAEMARWRHVGHALPAFVVLARVAGFNDTEIGQALESQEARL